MITLNNNLILILFQEHVSSIAIKKKRNASKIFPLSSLYVAKIQIVIKFVSQIESF